MKLSYLNLTTTDPTINLATEQYVFENLPKDRAYFMLCQNAPSVIIGKHQNTLAEINEPYIRQNGIHVVRRLSGGGAVYHDLGNLNFTFVTDAKDQGNINFELFCQPVINALKAIGIDAKLNGRNDITIDGKKFSGNSQYIKDGRVLHHGTILFNSNLSVVSNALNVDKDKIQSKGVKSVRSRVTNVSDFLAEKIPLGDFRNILLNNILKEQDATEYILTEADLSQIEQIANNRYRTWDWNYGHSPEFTLMKKARFHGCGTIEVYITANKGIISDVKFHGDFFSAQDPENLAMKFIGIRTELNDYADVVETVNISDYFAGLTSEQFLELMEN